MEITLTPTATHEYDYKLAIFVYEKLTFSFGKCFFIHNKVYFTF